MIKNAKNFFTVTRAVPNGKLKFFFSTLKDVMISKDTNMQTQDLEEPFEINIEGKTFEISKINSKNTEGIVCDPKNPFETRPRMLGSIYQRPRAELERII